MFKIFGLILASDATIQRYIDKTLEQRLDAISPVVSSLVKGLEESNARIGVVETGLSENTDSLGEVESKVSEFENKIEEFPDPSDVVTSESFSSELDNHDIVTRDDLGDYCENDSIMDHVDFSDIGDHLDMDDLAQKIFLKIAEGFAAKK